MKEYIPQQLSFSELLEKAKSLPLSPGVYLFFDVRGQIIYVGKSRALKNRVLSYFTNIGKHNAKTQRLVQCISDFQTIVTFSETEALILENEKIKLHMPKFNIRLKDDKDYPYICLSTDESFPRLSFARKRGGGKKGARYFGPYSSSATVHSLIDTANKLFCLPTCKRKFPRDIGRERPCLYYQMGRCVGVCTGKVSREEYQRRMEDVILFFRHDYKKIASDLEKKMEEAAQELQFERAAALRDRIAALKTLSETKQVVRDLHFHADVFGIFSDEAGGCIHRLSVREGRLADSISFHFGADEILSAESFCSMLISLYRGREDMPSRILLPASVENEEYDATAALLSAEGHSPVRFVFPRRGEGRALLKMAEENAKAATLHRRAQMEKDQSVLISLAKLLSLEVVPERIESIDISNSGSSAVSAGIITVENARFLKRAYKSFTLSLEHPDDLACMYEAVSRRIRRYRNGDAAFSPLPDLILVDGAEGQVAAVKKALQDQGISLPVFGMVKDAFHKTRCLTDGEREISIAFDTALFRFVYGIQEEVHRFSLSRMDSQRRRGVKKSSLTAIEGIGEKKAGILLREWKSIQAIRKATEEELAQTKGISAADARRIYQHYQNLEKRDSEK
ncbi:MAG: excinuclease ABC subunit UvrC [Clostridia bacterium]|nr:excinuclease ABC subunit UvrC [Clostridia bacterium]